MGPTRRRTPETTPAAEVDETEKSETEKSETDPDEGAEEEAEASGDGEAASWAKPTTVQGDKIGTAEVGPYTVDIYQVGTAKAPEDGRWVDPDTNKPLITKGDEIVFLNYVFTNTSGEETDTAAGQLDVEPRYDDWQWAQGMGGITDSDLYEQFKVTGSSISSATDYSKWDSDDEVQPTAAGAVFSYGTNFKYQKGSPITITVKFIPKDVEGDLIHDDGVEEEIETKIN